MPRPKKAVPAAVPTKRAPKKRGNRIHLSEVREFALPPERPNPVIDAMQEQILALVQKRTERLDGVAMATGQVEKVEAQCANDINRARAILLTTQRDLQRIEDEVQYRFRMIEQLRGGQPLQASSFNPPPMAQPFSEDALRHAPPLIRPHPSFDPGSPIRPADNPYQEMTPFSSLPLDAAISSIPAPMPQRQQQPQRGDDSLVNRSVVGDGDRAY